MAEAETRIPTRPFVIGIAAAVALVLIFFFANLLLLIFAAILVGAALDEVIKVFRMIGLPRPAAFALSVIALILLAGAGIAMGGMSLIGQFDDLTDVLGEAWDVLARWLNEMGVPVLRQFTAEDIFSALPAPESMFGSAGAALGMGLGLLSNMFIVLLIGAFLAVDPSRYRDGAVLLISRHHRARAREVMDKVGWTLQRWVVAQLALMAIVGTLTSGLLFLLGIPNALALGLIAGLLNFIPFLGPILAFVPIGLAMIGQDWGLALLVLAGYTVIQQLDANLFSPLIQDRVVNLAPALTVAMLLLFGIALGPLGVVLATPLLATIRTLVLELYVGDVLGDRRAGHVGEEADPAKREPGTIII